MPKLLSSAAEVREAIKAAPPRGPCTRVLMADPAHFTVESAINPWMRDAEGNLNRVDAALACDQWQAMAQAYRDIGIGVETIAAPAGLPDFCFAANQSLVFADDAGRAAVLLSQMASDTRVGEVPHFRDWFATRGYRVIETPATLRPFEGTGDAIRHHGRHVYWGGVGPRTGLDAWRFVAETTRADVIPLKLVDPAFYHLDTCLCVLSDRSAMYISGAFDAAGLELLRAGFDDLLPLEPADAANFACNAHCPDSRHVLIQRGSAVVNALRARDFSVIELDTTEFMKSGGSVFCLKQEL